MKKLINNPDDVVAEALLGIEAAHPDLRVDHEHKVIHRADGPRQGKVGIISGGGSGHEPLHGGFVGLVMLDAACAGEVFTSPVPDQMLAATKLVDGGAGVLHVVKNYTGDVMNFEMAAELAASETGARVVSVVTDDDVAAYRRKALDLLATDFGIPDIEERIVFERTYTSRDFTSDYHALGGSALGLAHTMRQTAFRPNNVSKKLSNLYYVGASTSPGSA